MPTTDEKNVLKILEEEGGERGELHEVKISRYMGLRLDYIRSILSSMGRRDLVDASANGKVRVAAKGWSALGKAPGGGSLDSQETAPESPTEKYRRWMSAQVAQNREDDNFPDVKNTGQGVAALASHAQLTPEERLKKWTSK